MQLLECDHIVFRARRALLELEEKGFGRTDISMDDLAFRTGCHDTAALSLALAELQSQKIIDLDPQQLVQ